MTLRPLVMRCGAFGDMVLLTALLRQLHSRFGQPADVICSGPWSAPLLAGQPGVGDIFTIGSRIEPFWISGRQRALVRWLRARAPGPAWFCDPGTKGRSLLRHGNIPDSHVCEDSALPWIPGEHFVHRWVRSARLTPPAYEGRLPPPAPDSIDNAVLEIPPTSAALQPWLERRGLADRDLIVIQAGNKRSMRKGSKLRATNTKYWPEERWAAVIRALRDARPEHTILLLGVPGEYRFNSGIAKLAAVRDVHNVADDLPIPILLPLLARASSMVSVDTGPAHAAAALGCPTVALFGISDPKLYRPGGVTTPAVTLTGEIDGRRTMLGIDVQTVVSAWQQLNTLSSGAELNRRRRAAPPAGAPE